jgi:hypothetical protein
MMLRFMGEVPHGKFEFQCECGRQTLDEHIKRQVVGDRQKFTCPCGKIYTVWQQSSHWHIYIDTGDKK